MTWKQLKTAIDQMPEERQGDEAIASYPCAAYDGRDSGPVDELVREFPLLEKGATENRAPHYYLYVGI